MSHTSWHKTQRWLGYVSQKERDKPHSTLAMQTCLRNSLTLASGEVKWCPPVVRSILCGDNHRRIKRGGVASEFAIHLAGEIDASDQVLPKGVFHAAQAHGLVAESK